MLTVMKYDLTMSAILENAFDVSYERPSNAIWTMKFSLPFNDPKSQKVEQLGFVELVDTDTEYLGLYRVMPKYTEYDSDGQKYTYACYHVVSTLMDSVIFGYHQIPPNTKTSDSIDYLLNQQKKKHWVLGDCEFTRYFEYSWENENGLLNPLWSIATPFDSEYIWTYDTTVYPWVINLKKPNSEPVCRIREGYNLEGFTIEEPGDQIINRIYPIGQAEGVNQLTIERVNPTKKKYVEDLESIARYGTVVEYIWKDQRFTNEQSLYESALAMLKSASKVRASWTVNVIDLIKAARFEPIMMDKLRVNQVVQIYTEKYGYLNLRIVKDSKADMFGNPGDLELELNNTRYDFGMTLADTERRIEINETYSQGQTSLATFDKSDNADANSPVRFTIYIDDDMINVNTCELTFETTRFRAYSKATKGGGATTKTTGGGGAIVKSTEGGGGKVTTTAGGGGVVTSTTSEAAGQSTNTSSANGSHRHKVFTFNSVINRDWAQETTANMFTGYDQSMPIIVGGSANQGDIYTAEAVDDHTHSVTTPSHTHTVPITLENHSHSLVLEDHVHTLKLDDHTHQLVLPDHTHEILYGINEYSEDANAVIIKVDGVTVPGSETIRERLDIVPYLSRDPDGTVTKGRHTVTLQPNTLARIDAQISMRVFIKSQLGGKF